MNKSKIIQTAVEVGTCIIRSIYNRPHTQKIREQGESLTQQQFTKDANVNTIMQKYARTGIVGSGLGTRQPQFGDYTGVDYREMETKMANSVETFKNLPSKLRKRFDNSVGSLLDFLDKEENREEAEKLGLIPTPEPEPPQAPKTEGAKGTPEPPAGSQAST